MNLPQGFADGVIANNAYGLINGWHYQCWC